MPAPFPSEMAHLVRPRRSHRQNRYYFGVVCPALAGYMKAHGVTPCDKDARPTSC